MDTQYAITADNISKIYRLYGKPIHRLMERAPWNKRPLHRQVTALQNIHFKIEPGQCVGLIGANGAGKSTLLKILTGTTLPTTGRFSLRGKVQSLLELGAGFSKGFTGRENIIMNLAIQGFSRREAMARVDEIADFSELGAFIDAPVKTYSSGMACRLGFAVAVASDPDVLILDEVLAVGDMGFQRKCHDKIWEYKTKGKTMFFCSHSLYHVRQMCDTAFWLRKGEIAMHGSSVEVTNEYATFENQQREHEYEVPGDEAEGPAPTFSEQPHIVSATLLDPRSGQPSEKFGPGDPVAVRVHVRNGTPLEELTVAVGFVRSDGTLCFCPTTEMDGVKVDFQEGFVTLLLKGVRLLSGEFEVPVWLLDKTGMHRLHEKPTAKKLVIANRNKELGLFLQDREWRVEGQDQSLPATQHPSERANKRSQKAP